MFSILVMARRSVVVDKPDILPTRIAAAVATQVAVLELASTALSSH